MNNKIIISNMFRAKNRQAFFALHQIHNKILSNKPDAQIQYHILWDNLQELNDPEKEKWSKLIDGYGFDIVSYDKEFFIEYANTAYDMDKDSMRKCGKRFIPLYLLLMGHYMRRVLLFDYYLIYDDDILISYDFKDVTEALLEKKSVFITEPFNQNCDKVLLNKLVDLYGVEFFNMYKEKNPELHGFNAGFQGISLRIYDDYLCSDRFQLLLTIFDMSGVIDSDGNEIWGHQRFTIDTQQQSFFGIMNILKNPNGILILDPTTCYVAPTFGSHPILGTIDENDGNDGWSMCLKSKISHFIGHTQGKGKPRQFIEKMDEYLKKFNYI
jgi:hypothetical protein